MVNKCSVTGCKSLYVKNKNNVKLHRFPLSNPETLPLWIAATGREKEWKPSKSSRLCGNHFQANEYVVGHGKGVLKTTSVPTIEYRLNPMTKYGKKTYFNSSSDEDQLKVDSEDGDPNVEIVQLGYKDMYNFKYGHQNKDNNYEQESLNENEDEKIKNNKHPNCSNLENNYDGKDDSSHDEAAIQNGYGDFNNEIKNDICNRENQCYMFTSSFKEGADPIILTTPEDKQKPSKGLFNTNVDQSTEADSNFDKIMALKLKRKRCTKDIYSLYFKSLNKKKLQKQEKNIKSYNIETASFAAFIEAQMKEIRPYRKTYLTTKHKIQKILMKAQLKIANAI